MKINRLMQALNLDPAPVKPNKEATPEQVIRYLEERKNLRELLLNSPTVNPHIGFNKIKAISVRDSIRSAYMQALYKFLNPIIADLKELGCKDANLHYVVSETVHNYLTSDTNRVIAHLNFPQFAVANLYLRADIPLWKAFLPQILAGEVKDNWKAFYSTFNNSVELLKSISPTMYRQLFRSMHNTDVFEKFSEGEVFTFLQPSSCTQDVGYADKFMHPDVVDFDDGEDGKLRCIWGSEEPLPTKGDVQMQIFHLQDSVNNMAIWMGEEDDDPDDIAEAQDSEHLILEGTQVEILLKADAIHPRSKRPVTFIVAQDVRSKVLGQQQYLLEALNLEKGGKS